MDLPRFYSHSGLPSDLAERIATRDSALWIGTAAASEDPSWGEAVSTLAVLPWNLILIEDSSAAIAKSVVDGGSTRFSRVSGHRISVAGSITDVSFPTRSVPVLFLNGREDGPTTAERPDATGRQSKLLRRLGMLDELLQRAVPSLVLLPSETDDLAALLYDTIVELRPHVIALAPPPDQIEQLRRWSTERPGPVSVTVCTDTAAVLASALAGQLDLRLPSDRLLIRVRKSPDGPPEPIDCTGCVPIDSPVFDAFTVLQEQHIASLAEDSLDGSDIDGFFARTADESDVAYWRPYAAGLPWPRDDGYASKALLDGLARVRTQPSGQVRVFTVDSEPGAGGTTASRTLAFDAARAGYPTLIAKTGVPAAEPEVVISFLHAIGLKIRSDAAQPDDAGSSPDTDVDAPSPVPWLIVLDAEHWSGREDLLPAYVRVLQRFVHRAVLLLVRDLTMRTDLSSPFDRLFLAPLSHELAQQDVDQLGQHLNRFLTPLGRHQSLALWRSFWQENTLSPEPGTMGVSDQVSSFWVALEFWLRRQLNLGESIRSWLYDQFSQATYRNAPLAVETRRTLLTIASLSLERTHYPEPLLPPSEGEADPLSAQLFELSMQVPALGLVRRKSGTSSTWSVSHLPLAQHLIDAAADDVQLLTTLGIERAVGTVRLRLLLLSTLARLPALSQKRYRPFALHFAQAIFKLDRSGHQEFARYWRDVFNALFEMPSVLWDVSRAFNHHVSISRRRVAVDDVLFPDTTDEERFRLLDDAVVDLEYALSIEQVDDDERDLNILNSLSRACQDLASLLNRLGRDPDRITELQQREIECLHQAEILDPTNSHVLETTARSLLLVAERDPTSAPANTCAALQRIATARGLDTAFDRRNWLDSLTAQAYELLLAVPDNLLDELRTSIPAVAAMVSAWRILRREQADGSLMIADSAGSDVALAIDALESVAPHQRDWPLTRLLYDLVSIQEPFDFDRQLQLLKALEGTPAIQLQLRVELAILLHQVGAHPRAEREFRDVRRAFQNSDAYIVVPRRLAWFLQPGTDNQAVCDGRVVPPPGPWRRHAMRIQQLGNTVVGFFPLDFGFQSIPAGRTLKCAIGFNFRGPYAAPAPHV